MSITRWMGLLALVLIPFRGLAAPQQRNPVTFEVALPELEGPVTMGIFSEGGALVRLLYRDVPADTIPSGLNGLLMTWDGCDESGTPVSPGTYRARGFVHGSLKSTPIPVEDGAPSFSGSILPQPGVRSNSVSKVLEEGLPAPDRSVEVAAAEDPLYSPRPMVSLTPRVAEHSVVLEANGMPLLAWPVQEKVVDATLLPRTETGLIRLRIFTPGSSRLILLSGLDKLAPIEAGTLDLPSETVASPGGSQQ